MELVKLDSNLRETNRFSRFESLLWSERYQKPGIFQMRCPNIQEALDEFQMGDLVGVSNSDYVMQIQNFDISTDYEGNDVLEISGTTLETIFTYRPVLIGSASYIEANAIDLEEGDPQGEEGTLYPVDLIKKFIRKVDNEHYGRSELSKLKLPFTYKQDLPNVLPGTSGYERYAKQVKLPYFAPGKSDTVDSIIGQLYPFMNKGVATVRPDGSSPIQDSDRPCEFIFYTPRWLDDLVSFEYLYEDYYAEKSRQSSTTPNINMEAREDYIRIFDREPNLTGLNARVGLSERAVEDLSGWAYDQKDRDFAKGAFAEYKAGLDISFETSGVFPYHTKQYNRTRKSNNTYFLGDSVRVVSKTGDEYSVQLIEFVRTMDSEGYIEYPKFSAYSSFDTEAGIYTHDVFNKALTQAVNYEWN